VPLLSSYSELFRGTCKICSMLKPSTCRSAVWAYRLDSQRLPKGARDSIQRLFEIEKYTHLIVADVQMVGPETGLVDLLVAKLLPNGSVEDRQVIQTIRMTTTTNLADIRNQVFRNFGKFRDANAPRTVFIKCIVPRSTSANGNIPRMERLLGREVTNALINLYHSAKMQGRYRAIVDNDTYRWDDKDMSCSSTSSRVTSTKPDQFDYSLGGVVAISHPTEDFFGYDNLDLAKDSIQVSTMSRKTLLQISRNICRTNSNPRGGMTSRTSPAVERLFQCCL
jgi:hypothetical protein